jgi:hypothetical protein
MPARQSYLVGRQTEIDHFASLIRGRVPHWLLNIYGPGGIGKTVVGQKIRDYAQQAEVPLAFVDGMRPDLTPDRILHTVSTGFAEERQLAGSFTAFERAFEEYLMVQEVLKRGGGLQAMFDVLGTIKDPSGLSAVLGNMGKTVTTSLRNLVSNRFALERYLRGVEKVLTQELCEGLSAAVERAKRPLALVVDTYEELEGLDDWVCSTFIPALPEGVKLVVLGRNALPKVNFDWGEYGAALYTKELPELAEAEAKAYLVHHGLRDPVALDSVVRFTGGYPLLLVLVVHLSREAGGWAQIGTLEAAADRDRIATQLLERILREERAHQVRDFLEYGVVARWFNPEIVSVVLKVSPEEGRTIYDRLQRHSFVERHPYGLKFHDKIRELLLARLKFNQAIYDQITKRLLNYYAEKAGLEPTATSSPSPEDSAKYEVHIHDSSSISIGDAASVQSSEDPAS